MCPDSPGGWHDWVLEAVPARVSFRREDAESSNPEDARILTVTVCRRCGAVL